MLHTLTQRAPARPTLLDITPKSARLANTIQDSGVRTDYISPRGTVLVDFPGGTCYYCRGSAVAVASEDVSVIVENRKASSGATAAYPGFRTSQATTRLGLPLIFHTVPSAGHIWDTKIIVHNPNVDPASVTVRFYPGGYAPQQNIPANGTRTFNHYATGFFGSAVVSSDQPVVAVVREYSIDEVFASAYPALLPSTLPIQLPLLFKQIYSQGEYWNTAFQVQNLGDSPTNVSITYVCEFGGCSKGETCVGQVAEALDPNEAVNFDQRYHHLDECGWDTFFGSAKVKSSGEPIAVAVNQRPLGGSGLTGRLGTYVGAGGGELVHMPRLQKYAGGWSTSVTVRNAGAQDVTISLYYYDAAGNPRGTHSETIEGEGTAHIDQRYDTALGGVSSLDGSGVLIANRSVAVVVNRRHDPPGDNLCSYNGITP
jgi:hypothetical protein